MTTIKNNLHKIRLNRWLLLPCVIILYLYSCEKISLDETPLSLVSDVGVLSSPEGFELYAIGLHQRARNQMLSIGWSRSLEPTDMYSKAGLHNSGGWDWISSLTPFDGRPTRYWSWAYTQIIPQANIMIEYGNMPDLQDIWASEAERNAILAEAYFFRGWAYKKLAHLFGGVPILDKVEKTPRYNYVRNSRREVYEFAAADLEFASQWLPTEVPAHKEGRVVRAAADHALSEVYISLGEYDKAIDAASRVIDSDLYHLMTYRFGAEADMPGDPFSDLFKLGNYNRSSGNMESIYVWQFQEYTDGGGPSNRGNGDIRMFAPALHQFSCPDGYRFQVTDSLGRGIGDVIPTTYTNHYIWQDNWDDMRNNSFNMRRDFYYNDPRSSYYLTKVQPEHITDPGDSLHRIYPYPKKMDGPPWQERTTSGGTGKDKYVIRLAETYLLRAEAYLRNDDPVNAALDINVVRDRANATPVSPGDVTLEYILDERARELMTEEMRTLTLMRMGKLVERVRLYSTHEHQRATVQDYHELWPIPQTAIDANLDVVLVQNPGYE